VSRVGNYEVLGPLGSGGAGAVFRARSADGREVAIKLLRLRSPEAQARFDRERRLLWELGEADGFVPLLDAGVVAAGPYLVMPVIRGGTLRARLQGGPLDGAATLTLARELGRALSRAHARGIVHRDLKPENIFFTEVGATPDRWGRVLVGDLGLAKHFESDDPEARQSRSLSHSGNFAGTPGYMAPEQVDDSKSVGPSADIFALGAILHECLTGQPAFSGETIIEVIDAITKRAPRPPRALGIRAPRELEAALMKALERDSADRPADGVAFLRLLEAPPARRGLAMGLAIASLLAVLVAGAALAVRARGPVTPPPPGPPSPGPSAPGPPEPVKPSRSPASELVELARSLAVKRESAAARDLLVKAVALEPKNARAHADLGIELATEGDVAGAYAEATLAVALDPKLAAAWQARGLVRIGYRDFVGARSD
jgi:serine/threonine protein kinase